MPKFYLLYFKSLLDIAFIKFFQSCNDAFMKVGNEYVLSKAISKSKLKSMFRQTVVDVLKEVVEKQDMLHPKHYLIIGACMPKDNLMLSVCKCEFPAKDRLLNAKYQVKYILKEQDIKIDNVLFNQVCIDVFNDFFVKNGCRKWLGKEYSNVEFIVHKQLDCYTVFKVLKHLIGRSNCINLHKDKFKEIKSPIVAVNDLIDKYATDKLQLNKSAEFKTATEEIKQYLKTKNLIQ